MELSDWQPGVVQNWSAFLATFRLLLDLLVRDGVFVRICWLLVCFLFLLCLFVTLISNKCLIRAKDLVSIFSDYPHRSDLAIRLLARLVMRLDLVCHPNLIVQVTSWIKLFGSLLYGKNPILFAVIDLDYVVKNWPSKRPRIKWREAWRNDLDCYWGLIDNQGQRLVLLGAVGESRILDLEQGTLVKF